MFLNLRCNPGIVTLLCGKITFFRWNKEEDAVCFSPLAFQKAGKRHLKTSKKGEKPTLSAMNGLWQSVVFCIFAPDFGVDVPAEVRTRLQATLTSLPHA